MTALRNAYEIIKDEERFCTGTSARDGRGQAVDARDPEAVRWCAIGALERTQESVDEYLAAFAAISKSALQLFGYNWIPSVNDNLGHEAVVQVFEKALVEQEGGL